MPSRILYTHESSDKNVNDDDEFEFESDNDDEFMDDNNGSSSESETDIDGEFMCDNKISGFEFETSTDNDSMNGNKGSSSEVEISNDDEFMEDNERRNFEFNTPKKSPPTYHTFNIGRKNGRILIESTENLKEIGYVTSLHGWRKTHHAGKYEGYFDFEWLRFCAHLVVYHTSTRVVYYGHFCIIKTL